MFHCGLMQKKKKKGNALQGKAEEYQVQNEHNIPQKLFEEVLFTC